MQMIQVTCYYLSKMMILHYLPERQCESQSLTTDSVQELGILTIMFQDKLKNANFSNPKPSQPKWYQTHQIWQAKRVFCIMIDTN